VRSPRVSILALSKADTRAGRDFRIDFEDGFGSRPDAEEDSYAQLAATEVLTGLANDTLPVRRVFASSR